jgi:hypothetical protein
MRVRLSIFLLADWLSTLWPRWLLLLGFVLIMINLWMQPRPVGLRRKALGGSWKKRNPDQQ